VFYKFAFSCISYNGWLAAAPLWVALQVGSQANPLIFNLSQAAVIAGVKLGAALFYQFYFECL